MRLDLWHLGHGVDRHQAVLLGIVVQDWSGLFMVSIESLDEGLLGIISSLNQWLSSNVVNSILLWWVELHVIASAGCLVDSSSLDSLNEYIVINLELNNLVDFLSGRFEHGIELLGLDGGSWETVEEHASLALWLIHLLLEKVDDKFVTHEISPSHDILGLLSKLSSFGNSISKEISSGQMADAKLILDNWSLSSLSGTWWAHHDDVHCWLGHAHGSSLDFGEKVVKLCVSKVRHL